MPPLSRLDIPVFTGLSPDQRIHVERQMVPRRLSAGEVLCRAGDEGDSLYVVSSGLLHAVADARRGCSAASAPVTSSARPQS